MHDVSSRATGRPAHQAVDPTGTQSMLVSDQTLVDLRKSFDNRLFGLHGLDLSLPTNELVAGIEDAVTKHGLHGAVMEPGGRLYVEAISMLPDQFIHASAYPLGPIMESVEMALKFPLSDDVMEKYMYGNAARLLNVTAQSKKLQVA
jgi:hypothetical protein